MNFEEFLKPTDEETAADGVNSVESAEPSEDEFDNLDVQKAVVESLAADKAIQDEKIAAQETEIAAQKAKLAEVEAKLAELEKLNGELKRENAELKSADSVSSEEFEALKAELAAMGDKLAANTEGELSNQVALLDRNLELPDRFPSETRDQVLEVIKEAYEAAEKDGRLRRAQLLEGVLATNQPSGALQEKRDGLRKLFINNQNLLSGPVINILDKCGIVYKHGEEYLLPEEIIKRTY